MELITCANGHTYDPSISPNCPQCAGHTVPLAEPSFFGDDIGKTVPLRRDTVPVTPPVPVQWADPGVSYGPAASASKNEAVTMPVNYDQGGISEKAELPVTGWLVCVDGPEKGRDYRLHEEYNYIGRSLSANRSTLVSMLGQYRGPTPWIVPSYMGLRCRFSRMIRWVSALV